MDRLSSAEHDQYGGEMTLWSMLRKFRRQYHWASEIYRALGKRGSLAFAIQASKVDHERFQSQVETRVPDQDLMARLAVLMYPLLNPDSDLYWRRIFIALEERFPNDIPQACREQVEAHAHRLADIGAIPIQFNGERLDPQRLYFQLAKGFYFGREPQAQAELQALLAVPLMGPLLWYSFYNYTVSGFELMAGLFNIVDALSETNAFQDLRREQGIGPGRCIYCTRTEGEFTSEEHVMPEALGNDELVLEPGYVCDPCNNGLLARLDRTLVGFGPIAFLKTLYVPHIKEGRLPSANLQNMEIKKTMPTHVEIRAKDRTGLPREEEKLADGSLRFSISARGGTSDMTLVARAYFKIALGTVAHDCGANVALDQRYEPARAFIRGERGFPSPLLLNSSGEPHGHIAVSRQKLEPGSVFCVDIFGVIATFNLEVEPLIQLPADFDSSRFIVIDLKKPGSGRW